MIPVSRTLGPLALALALAFAGCSVHQVEDRPLPLLRDSGEYAGARPESRGDAGARPPSRDGAWWLAFEDSTLDALVREALASNLDLERAAARIESAAATLRESGARLFPALDADASYESRWTERSGDVSSDGGRGGGDEHDESASIGLTFSWELDIWGRLRAGRRAAELDVEAARSMLEDARLLISASVAETYFEILEQRRQLALIERQIATNTTLLELTRLRFGQGQSSIVDVLQQREQLASTNALVPAARARLDELEYVLDVLLGGVPGNRARISVGDYPRASEPPPLGMPSELLDARPDLRAAKQRVVALDHRVAEAIADRLPRFGIGASLAGSGDLRPDTLLASTLGEVVAPIFDAGARVARVDLRRAELREAVAIWSRDYLNAVREVESAVALERGQVERVRLQEQQLSIARELLRETRNRYSQGLTDYLPVLDALATAQELERDLITARRARLSLRVALHRALGGPMTHESKTEIE